MSTQTKQDLIYYVETPDSVFWSSRKMDVQYKHVEYLYRDKVKYKSCSKKLFNGLQSTSKKKFYELNEESSNA